MEVFSRFIQAHVAYLERAGREPKSGATPKAILDERATPDVSKRWLPPARTLLPGSEGQDPTPPAATKTSCFRPITPLWSGELPHRWRRRRPDFSHHSHFSLRILLVSHTALWLCFFVSARCSPSVQHTTYLYALSRAICKERGTALDSDFCTPSTTDNCCSSNKHIAGERGTAKKKGIAVSSLNV